MSDATPEVVNILARLVAFDTTSSRPNRACIDWIGDYLRKFGIDSSIVAGNENGKACLWATLMPKDADAAAKPGIVLAGHTDTVPVEGQDWHSDPFTLSERDGRVFARGACDMKGFIACALAAVPDLIAGDLAQPVHFALTHDEETTMAGAENLASYLRGRKIVPHWVWIGEPTSLALIDSHKGVAAYKTSITGVPGHSSQPDKGLNAIALGMEFMQIVQALADDKRAHPVAGSVYDPPYTTFNLGIVAGGTAENIIAEHFDVTWQSRAHPGDDLAAVIRQITDAADAWFAPHFKAFTPQAGIKTCTCFDIPPLLPTVDNPGQAALGRATGNTETQAVSFATEGGFFQSLGTHVVVCGPGDIDNAHKANESVGIDELVACVDLIWRVLLCSAPAR